MSHTVKRQSAFTDQAIVDRTARHLGAEVVGHGKHRLYGGTQTGYGVKLPGWRYPIVIDLKTGDIKMDNYGGSWGAEERLADFRQRYTVEGQKKVAEQKGHKVREMALPNGDIELHVTVGGEGMTLGGGGGGSGMTLP